MSATDNWIRIYRWWQEHLKSHFSSSSSSIPSTIIENQEDKRSCLLHRRSSLMSFRSSIKSQSTTVKKRASFGGVEQHKSINNGGFRYVRDSIRNKNSRTTTTTTNTNHNKRLVHSKVD